MSPKKDAYMRGYVDGFKDGIAEASKAFGETGMVPVTGKERPMLRPEAASTKARFESASLHQPTAV
jgi:hypothetical protein